MTVSRLPLLLALLALAGCPSTVEPDDAPEPTDDTPALDTPIPVDVGADTPTDAGTDAPEPRDPCDTPGAMEIRTCGFCGEASFRCEGGFWERTTPCINERECAAGGFETRTNELCGEETRLCSGTCTWGDWSRTRPDGECRAGERRVGDGICPPMEAEFETCDASCMWDTSGVCEDADGCAGTPRTSPHGQEEVCVPAGPYIRQPDVPAWRAEIMVSAFYIDRYPVTNGRMTACQDAGGCSAHPDPVLGPMIRDPAAADRPVALASPDMAAEFCAWDGGRRLPSEAEWEKAARGPAPRTNQMPWDTAVDWRAPTERCALYCRAEDCFGFVLFDSMCGTRSHFSVELQIGDNRPEVVADYYRADALWFDDPRSMAPDPLQDESLGSPGRLSRGGDGLLLNPGNALSVRTLAGTTTGFRCARSAH